MSDAQYTFNTRPNAYFAGRDLRVTETGTGHTILVNVKDGYLAVNVKDDEIARNYPADVIAASEQIGEERAEAIYRGVQEDFWRWAEEAASRYKLDGIGQAGHSGGWLTVNGTDHFDGELLIDPSEGEEGDADLRDRLLAFFFEVERSIDDDWRPMFFEQVKAAAAEPIIRHRAYVASIPSETPIADPRSWTGDLSSNELSELLADAARHNKPGDRLTIAVETYEISRATVTAAAKLAEAGWEGPAGDLRDGVPPETVINRVREMTDDEEELDRAIPILAALAEESA